MCVFSLTHQAVNSVLLGQRPDVPQIQFNSDTTYPEIESDPTGEGLSPTRRPPFRCQSQGQVVTGASDLQAVNQSFPQPLPGVPLIC